jgi:hypothetical protein
MDGTAKSVKSKSSRSKTHNFSSLVGETILFGTGFQQRENTVWRMAISGIVAAQEILRAIGNQERGICHLIS